MNVRINTNMKVSGYWKDDEEKNIQVSMNISRPFDIQLSTHFHRVLESQMSKYLCFSDYDYICYGELSS